ncbi:MAG: response regulator [Candidatus Aminicenantes bacterium]|nr:response regulator [Candidatus Aminicenantes bacterium]NIM80078.1 response regulator [Candidatus Aminicenantes bacterium]NIN19420.1 response regulator [Candidatus Aminicenantes bacterium]NIN43319.1 response regulator [Candidatus Aminicenantes bacterium]NIN86063.1 response regulator [Candidatus Aminicenantes bacterium]
MDAEKKEKVNILIVDDRKENLLALEALLESPDLRIIKAESGNQALGLMLEFNFALILLDVQMPEMDGFEVAELMRRKEKTRNIPIIFITAIIKEEKYVFKGYEKGAVDYLFKPINPNVLKSKVNVFLELHRRKMELERLINEKNEYILELHQLNKKIQEQQKELLEKEKLQSILEMAVTISHEFSQPLSVIIGYADMLLNTMEKNDPMYPKLKKIMDNGEALAEVIRRVRSITNYKSITYTGESRMVDID